MSGLDLVLHIGLPKTGTTTLQSQLFPSIGNRYHGVRQPRNRLQPPLYEVVVGPLAHSVAVDQQLMEAVRLELGKALASEQAGSDKPFLISEEMFTKGLEWRTKLAVVAQVLEGTNYRILVTWRDPVEAAFAYYCELYSQFGRDSLVDVVRDNEAMKIYWGDCLAAVLETTFGRERVSFVTFEELFFDSSVRDQALRRAGLTGLGVMELRTSNARHTDGAAIVRIVQESRLRPLRTPERLKGMRSTQFARRIRSVERRILQLVPAKKEKYRIPLMTSSERKELVAILSPQVSALAPWFSSGVDS